jgi:hypothetical protein
VTRALDITVEAWELAVSRLPSDAAVPDWAMRGAFYAATRTPDELSIVCSSADVPPDVRTEQGWRCFSLAGPIPFEETGVLLSIAAPLAEAGIGIFAISTFDTDYVLVPGPRLADAVRALESAGHRVESLGRYPRSSTR